MRNAPIVTAPRATDGSAMVPAVAVPPTVADTTACARIAPRVRGSANAEPPEQKSAPAETARSVIRCGLAARARAGRHDQRRRFPVDVADGAV